MLKSLSFYTMISIISATLGFASILYLSNLLLPEDFAYIGIYGTVVYILAPLVSFNTVGLVAINIIDYEKDKYQIFINNYLTFIIFTSLFLFIIGCIMYLLNIAYIQVIIMSYLIAITLVLITIHNSELIQNKEIKLFGFYKILLAITNILSIYLFVDLIDLSWIGRLIGLFASNIIILILMYIISYESIHKYHFSFEVNEYKKYLKYGFPLIVGLGASWMITQMDKYIVLYYFTMKDLGYYSFGYTIGMSFVIINQSLVNAISPKIYKILKDGIGKKIIYKYSLYYNIFIIAVVLLAILLIKNFGYLVLNLEYMNSINIIILIMIASALDGMYRVYGLVINYYKENTLRTKIDYFIVVINILFSILLIPYYHVLAPAIGTIIAYFLGFLISKYYAQKILVKKGVR